MRSRLVTCSPLSASPQRERAALFVAMGVGYPREFPKMGQAAIRSECQKTTKTKRPARLRKSQKRSQQRRLALVETTLSLRIRSWKEKLLRALHPHEARLLPADPPS